MFKSILDWIIGIELVNRWILVLMLAGMTAGIAVALKNIGKKTPEGEK